MMKKALQIIAPFILIELLNFTYNLFVLGLIAFTPFTHFNAPSLYYDMDDSFGVSRRPNVEIAKAYPWGSIKFETNSKGFRDDEFKDGDILITGNSFIEGFGIKTSNRFSEQIEAKKPGVYIANAGSAGVWSAIQSLVAIRDLNNGEIQFKKNIIVLTPSEVLKLGKRNPSNDRGRNFPYRNNDSISFYKSPNPVFNKNLTFPDKAKRLFKYTGTFRIFDYFKGYGAGKRKYNVSQFNSSNLDWFILELEKLDIDAPIQVVVLNGLSNSHIQDIEKYVPPNKNIDFKVLNFSYSTSDYFASNGHLNADGNMKLAELLIKSVL